jgi:hypothetical protein
VEAGLWDLLKKGVVILRWRVGLALAGLALVLFSLVVIAYVFWPLGPVREQFRPAPTPFAPPQSWVIGALNVNRRCWRLVTGTAPALLLGACASAATPIAARTTTQVVATRVVRATGVETMLPAPTALPQ